MLRIEQDWYPTLAKAENGTEKKNFSIKTVKRRTIRIAPIFQQMPYFMNEEFGLVDCYVAPLLWKLKHLGVEFTGTGSKAIKAYMERVFTRDSFAICR